MKFESDWAKAVVAIVFTRSLYTECHSWPWPLTLWPKISRVSLLIIHNLHMKIESDWAKTVVAIVPTRSYTQSAAVDLDLWPLDPKSIGLLFSSFTAYMWSLKVIGQKLLSLSCHQVKCDGWPWPLTLWPKINRVPPLIIHNLHVKFESDWAKTVVAIVSTRSYTLSATVDLDLWPLDPKSIGFLLSSSTTYMWRLKVIGQKL